MSNITVFVNHVGQTILAEVLSEDKNTLKAKNPAVLFVQPNQANQLQVQLIPVFFREFVKQDKRKEGVVLNYNKDSIVTSEIELDEKIVEQYERIFSNSPAPAAAPAGKSEKTPVIKLFDD